MRGYQPKGGTIYTSHLIDKFDQIERLARKGLPVPRTVRLTRDLSLDPAQWGRYVVAKSSRGGGGRGMQLFRCEEIAARHEELTRNGQRQVMIQSYIEHRDNGYPTEFRVLTMFGKALYAARNRWAGQSAEVDDIAARPAGVIASNSKEHARVRAACDDADIIATGESAHAAFPECPVLGVDIVRDTATGQLHVMEVNPEGDTWHLSSDFAKATFTAKHVRELYFQFGALERAADLLVEKTRAEAS
jgi:glutathione synthase/RimK-type ligase-like ATP-grasp enzyme